MKTVEAALIALVVAIFTARAAVMAVYAPPHPQCAVIANRVAAWALLVANSSHNFKVLVEEIPDVVYVSSGGKVNCTAMCAVAVAVPNPDGEVEVVVVGVNP